MYIPIIVVCYNNYKYVENTLSQIFKINKEYYKNIIILDNCSNDKKTIKYLKNITDVKIIRNNHNNGPWVGETDNFHVYNTMPDKFILTDPDLQFNENMPSNFIEILSELSDKYKCHKIGLALDISDFNEMYQNTYVCGSDKKYNIYEWEIGFWKNKIEDDKYDLYSAVTDTTMCLINKNNSKTDFNNIRIGSIFTAKHLPWYPKSTVTNIYDNYAYIYFNTNKHISTSGNMTISYINNNYSKINKNDEFFFIEKNNTDLNVSFWENIYTNWENETFDVFDKLLDKNKIFIDIGAWIGTTSMYGSRKSKYVYSVDADKNAIRDMSLNMKNNCDNNYTIINKAIYNIETEIKFGKNLFLNDSKMNDSTSQIYDESQVSDEYYTVPTITPQGIIDYYNINTDEISLIKVDIEGGEEYIINELYNIHKKYNIPLYLSFHYSWWKNANLNRFIFLTENQKIMIIQNPFVSILFET
jgi:FkbM family methyltransferase